jgi:hypothetical protein
MMKAHLKRSWVQYMSIWMNEHGLEEICEPGGKQASGESSDICDSFLKYPILEAAASPSAVHLRMKVNVCFFILFHTVSYCFILFHTVSYCFTDCFSPVENMEKEYKG